MKSASNRAKAEALDLASQPHSPERDDADADAKLIIKTGNAPVAKATLSWHLIGRLCLCQTMSSPRRAGGEC